MTKTTNIVNGINVDDVMGLIQSVKDDAANGATYWQVKSEWQNGAHIRATTDKVKIGGADVERGFTLDIDEPFELGGTNQYANPQEYLLAALNACMLTGYSVLCALHGIQLEKLEVVTEGDIDLRGFMGLDPSVSPGYDALTFTVHVKGDATPEQFEDIHEMMLATSPNFHNISKAITMHPSLVVE
jgi:uncharacterized OsmC-like protein